MQAMCDLDLAHALLLETLDSLTPSHQDSTCVLPAPFTIGSPMTKQQ
jgi:hypothetical protein